MLYSCFILDIDCFLQLKLELLEVLTVKIVKKNYMLISDFYLNVLLYQLIVDLVYRPSPKELLLF